MRVKKNAARWGVMASSPALADRDSGAPVEPNMPCLIPDMIYLLVYLPEVCYAQRTNR